MCGLLGHVPLHLGADLAQFLVLYKTRRSLGVSRTKSVGLTAKHWFYGETRSELTCLNEGGFPPVTGKGRILCKSNYGIYYNLPERTARNN